MTRAATAIELAARAIGACHAGQLTARALSSVDLSGAGRVVGVATGKAASEMQDAVRSAAGGQRWAGGIVVTDEPGRENDYVGGHPLPDRESIRAGLAIEELLAAARLGPGDLLVACVSGGTSAVVALPVAGISLQDLRDAWSDLLAAGLDVAQVNAVRARLSRFHGGGLLELAAPARVVGLILCDVTLGAAAVGSAPTHAPPLSREEAVDLIRSHVRRGLRERLLDRLPTDPGALARAENVVVAEPRDLAEAAADAAASLGLRAELREAPFEGEAREAAAEFGAHVRRRAVESGEPAALIGWGEVTVTLAAGGGEGGRCQEFAWAGAETIAGADACIAAVASDGRDFTRRVAGAWVDGSTQTRAEAAGIDWRDVLEGHDSGPAHAALGQTIPGWRTGTNLCDLYLGITGSEALGTAREAEGPTVYSPR